MDVPLGERALRLAFGDYYSRRSMEALSARDTQVGSLVVLAAH